jgi:hypothetical protein
MRLGALVSCFGFMAAIASAAPATTPPVTPHDDKGASAPSVDREFAPLRLRRSRAATIPTNVDAQVLANLFAAEARSDFDVAVSTGTISCQAKTCRVALNVRLPETTAPVRLSFAVASPRGELSEVRHAECLTAICTVQLVLERGRNVIAVGASDAMTRGSGFATTQVNVDAPLTARRKSEWF